MRDREIIDSELRRLAAMRRSIRERGGEPLTLQVDKLLDERLGHRPDPSETEAVEAGKVKVPVDTWSQRNQTRNIVRYQRKNVPRRKGVLRRFSLIAALPLSLVGVASVLVVMLAVHKSPPAAQPPMVPPSSARPTPTERPTPPVPKAQAPQLDIVDNAFINGLKENGVPVPSTEYAMTHGHAVCDFLAHQPNFAEAVGFVQRSSVWDANQSADFAAAAVVSYCPQYEPTNSGEMQQAFQNALSDLQGIQRDLQGIRDDLQAFPGHQ
jgi:Protein of unknown function (DUF732)